ncbi:hypothetical protein ABZV60_24185 [Streptomyces sp. NPDC004787]|uniref:hypothetical protein n=1 Tax=Streptomyces sp. NPDC004787 TaxID=3154291 RepID=UPI0033B14E5D
MLDALPPCPTDRRGIHTDVTPAARRCRLPADPSPGNGRENRALFDCGNGLPPAAKVFAHR